MILTPNMVSSSIHAAAYWPDWRDAYAYLSHQFPDKWAWEYLRRNGSYQAAFNTFLPHWQACYGAGKYPRSESAPTPELFELSDAICRRFHLFPKGGLRNPNALMEPMFADEYVPHVEVLASWHNGAKFDYQIGEPESRYCVDVRIVGDRPLGEQIERIKAIYANITLGLKRAKPQRPQPTKNIAYLRCFDGRCAGATPREIAAILYPNEDGSAAAVERVKKQVGKAEALINGGYRVFVQRHWH